MLFHIPSKPVSESFYTPVIFNRHEITAQLLKNDTAVSEGDLIFSHSIGTFSKELTEECLPAINRRSKAIDAL